MKIVLINLIKGEYYEKIKALMILLNKKLFLSRMQMIEYLSNTLKLYNDKSDFYKFRLEKNCKNELRNFENLIIAEELVNEIYIKNNLRSNDLLTLKAIMEYFIGKIYFKFLCF